MEKENLKRIKEIQSQMYDLNQEFYKLKSLVEAERSDYGKYL